MRNEWSAMATDSEMDHARQLAERIVGDDVARGWKMYFQPGRGEDRMAVNVRGFLAEMIAARLTGLPRNENLLGAHYRRSSKPQDIGRSVEVRNQRNHKGPLYVYKTDPAHHLALLVTGSGRGPYVLRGWIPVAIAQDGRFHDESLKYPAFAVPQADLTPMPLPPDA
jgi:hypothetical protein